MALTPRLVPCPLVPALLSFSSDILPKPSGRTCSPWGRRGGFPLASRSNMSSPVGGQWGGDCRETAGEELGFRVGVATRLGHLLTGGGDGPGLERTSPGREPPM